MARIKSYPLDTDIKASDKIIGTDADTSNTKNFSLAGIKDFVNFKEDVVTVTTSELQNIGTTLKTIITTPAGEVTEIIGVLFKTDGNAALDQLVFTDNLVLVQNGETVTSGTAKWALPAATANLLGTKYYIPEHGYGLISAGAGADIVLKSAGGPTATGTPVMQLKIYIAYRSIPIS